MTFPINCGSPANTIKQLNIRNAEFWEKTSATFNEDMCKLYLAEPTKRIIQDEAARCIPIGRRRPMEQVMNEVRLIHKISEHEKAKARGSAPRKGDAISRSIDEIVRINPKIKVRGLLYELKHRCGDGVVTHIDSEGEGLAGQRLIHYTDDDGRPKSIKVSSLKDRLYRAKKKLARTSKRETRHLIVAPGLKKALQERL